MAGAAGTVEVAGVPVSRPDKVLFPEDGTTKLDLARYYAAVADVMLPHLAGRPVNMERFPDGIDGQGFYEKRLPSHFPDWVESVTVATSANESGRQQQVVVGGRATLVYLANQGCVTPHTWLCRAPRLERPDLLVLDLDPSTPDLAAVRRATRVVGEVLDDLGLTSFVKTTGSRGYHVVVPLRPREDFDAVRALARGVAEVAVTRAPELLTVEQRKAKREQKVFVDTFRNGYGQTAVPAYAVRARAGAPVSTPIEWEELGRVAPTRYDVRSVRRRLSQRGDPWHDLRRHAQGLSTARTRLKRWQ